MEKPEQFKSRKEWEEFIWQKVIKELTDIGSADKTQKFLEGLIGEYEKKLIIRRLTTILLLKEGLSYRAIGEILWVSPSTISAIKRSVLAKATYAPRRKHLTTKYKEQLRKMDLRDFAEDSFITRLENFITDFHKGYSDPKYRWRFLGK